MSRKKILTMLGILLATQIVVLAVSPEEHPEIYIKDEKKLFEERIKASNKKYADVRTNRKKKIVAAMEEYIEAVKKTRKYWTEKGILEKALLYKELQEKLEESFKKHKNSLSNQDTEEK